MRRVIPAMSELQGLLDQLDSPGLLALLDLLVQRDQPARPGLAGMLDHKASRARQVNLVRRALRERQARLDQGERTPPCQALQGLRVQPARPDRKG